MIDILDIHTHRPDATHALISTDPRDFDPQPEKWYSVGFHPWYGIDTLTDDDYHLLDQCARHPQVLAIGETGIDTLRGADLTVQADAFTRHLCLAHELGLPVVVHNVRATQHILTTRRNSRLDDVALIIHGMRGNAHVAQSLLEAGCYLSYGPRFNPDALLITPIDRLLIETDDSDLPITTVATRVAQAMNLPIEEIITHASSNARRLLSR